jgi:hypothetical protein
MSLLYHPRRHTHTSKSTPVGSAGDVALKDAWGRYQDALESELRMWYGAEDDLAAWHALCRAIGIDPLPRTCKQCQEVRAQHTELKESIYVNPKHRLYGERVSISLI